MNKTLMYLQADMHRAINSGQRDIVVSVLDLKELLQEVLKAEGREVAEKVGHGCGWINPEKLRDLRSGKRFYCTIRLRKNDEFSEQIFCMPEGKFPVDATAQDEQNTPLQSDD